VSDEIINFYKKAADTEEPQEPIVEQKETSAPVLPQPDEPFDKFLLELAEKLKNEKVITEKQQETFEEQIKQPVLEEDKNSDDPFKKFIGSFANILKGDELVNREENIKEATISFINKLKEQPEEPFIIDDQPLVKTKKKYLPPTIAKKVQKLPQVVKKEEPVVAEQADEPVKEEPKDENKYVQELKTADKTNKKIPEKIKSVSDIKSIVEKQVAEILSRYPNLGFTGGGGGTNAVQYAEGGIMKGDLNVTGKYLSGGVDISTLFSTGGGGIVSGIPDRLISGTETLILCSDGSISFPNNFISAPDGQVLNIQSETSSPSSFSRISLTPYAFFAYDNEGNSISFDVVDNTIELISQNEYSWKFNNQGVLVGPGNKLTVTSLSSLGKILSGGKDLLDIFALSGTGGGGGSGRDDINTLVIENSAKWILDGGNTKGSDITIGTNDGYSLNFETSGVTRMIVTDTGNTGFGGTPYARVQYVLENDTDPPQITAWDNRHVQWGTGGAQAPGLGMSYSSNDGTINMAFLEPSIAWKNARMNFGTMSWYSGDTTLGLVQDSSGLVGINTTAPSNLFDIYSTSLSKSIFTVNESTGVGTAAQAFVVGDQLGDYVNSGGHRVQIVSPDNVYQTPLVLAGGSANMEFWKDSDPSKAVAFGMATPGNAATDDLIFSLYGDSGWFEVFRVQNTTGNFGIGINNPTTKLEVDGTITTTSDGNSTQWNEAYNSIGNYLPLSGGTVTGDVTITGNLTALGTTLFQNTVFTTASTLSVINTGPGPALYVYQSSGPYDVASFYDGDGIEVLHVGNANPNGLGRIGINESFPNIELTVRGSVSATGTVFASAINISTRILSAGVNLLDIFTDDQTLYYTESSAQLSILNGNTVSLSSINSTFAANSGKYELVYTNVQSNSSNWQATYTNVQSNLANWNNAYNTATVYQTNSASYATQNYVNVNFLALSGGTISGPVRINNNLTINGNLTATGTTTFANTIFSVTSSLSVVHIGDGPALFIGNNGIGNIASFYDLDQNIEVFHIGGNNGTHPNVGVKTSTPNKDFTVSGEISATETIYANNYLSAGVNLLDIFTGGGGGGGGTAEKRFDYTTVLGIDYSYSGTAIQDTPETSFTWNLIRLTYNNNGTIFNQASAINSWTDRLTATYV
jgi:hypothetical protein